MKKVSVVISLYNSEKTIEAVVEEIRTTFGKLAGVYSYEIVLVDDRGQDYVYEVVKRLAREDRRIVVLRLAKNSGQTNAIIEGFRAASGDYIVEMDDDFQMPAYEIPRMLEKLESGDYDVVFAKYPEKKESGFRLFGSKVNTLMAEKMLGKPKDVEINSFYVMRRMVSDRIIAYSNNYPYVYGIIFAVTDNVANVEVDHRPRTNGRSNYTLRKLVSLWANGLLNYSVGPLRLSAKAGMVITAISFLLIILLVVRRVVGGTESLGWTSLMVTIIFFSGVQLLCVGLLGEYLGRLYISSSNLPRATVRETINLGDDKGTTGAKRGP